MIIATKVTLIGLADVKMLSKKKLTRPSTRVSLRAMPTSETFNETHFSLAFSVGVLKGSDDSMHGAPGAWAATTDFGIHSLQRSV